MNSILDILVYISIAFFAISGALAAGNKRMDLIGVLALSAVTALGGGTLRDLMLNKHPLAWIENPWLLVTALAAGFVTMHTARVWLALYKWLNAADAAGLALVAVLSTQRVIDAGHSPFVAIVMGVVSGVAGGVIRDVLANQIAHVMLPGELYATAAFFGSLTLLGLQYVGVPRDASLLLAVALCLGLRLASMKWNWRLPVMELEQSGPQSSDKNDPNKPGT